MKLIFMVSGAFLAISVACQASQKARRISPVYVQNLATQLMAGKANIHELSTLYGGKLFPNAHSMFKASGAQLLIEQNNELIKQIQHLLTQSSLDMPQVSELVLLILDNNILLQR